VPPGGCGIFIILCDRGPKALLPSLLGLDGSKTPPQKSFLERSRCIHAQDTVECCPSTYFTAPDSARLRPSRVMSNERGSYFAARCSA
jgi:hypothetical protein